VHAACSAAAVDSVTVLQWVQRMHSNWRELVADTDNDEDEDTVLTDMLSEAGRSENVPALQWLCV
jgi:hypothetical protein